MTRLLALGFAVLGMVVWADFADVEVLSCKDAKFSVSLWHTDTGDRMVIAGGSAKKTFPLHTVTFDHVNQSLALDPYILEFDDTKAPTEVKVLRPQNSSAAGASAKCLIKDQKLYERMLNIGQLSIPDDLTSHLYAGNFVTVWFHADKCDYTFLGEKMANCTWTTSGNTVTVQYENKGKKRTHVFHADENTKALVSRSATLVR